MHKSMRSLLLALVLYSICAYAQHECVATSLVGFSPEQFYTDPQDIVLEYCEMDSGKSCCSRGYSDSVGQYRDPFSFSFSNVIQTPTGTCREKLNGISCILCSTAQSDWILVQPTSSSLWMCQSYCDDLYTECGSEIDAVNGTLVSQSYPTSTDFCNRLFSQISESEYSFHLLLDQRTSQCWSGLRECTWEDYYAVYTSCTNNQRTRVYYKKPEVECNGGTPLPAPVLNLPCAMSCAPGQISGISSCLNCPRGFYSLGGTLALNTFSNWTQVNAEIPFETYCTHTDQYGVEHTWTESECGWELEGMQIASPRSLNDSMSAYLETSVTLIDDGLLQFTCTVDSEANYDGLKIFIDRTQVGGLIFGLSSYTTFNVSLSAGYHFIQFVYSKDGSVSRGADQAVINFIAITRVNYAADACDPCAPGTYTNHTGSAYCTKCPLNTYANRTRSTACTPCPDDEYALPGSSGCTPRPTCGPLAFYYLYGPCFYDDTTSSLKRQRYAVWTDPHICSSNTLPDPTFEDCAPCGPGQYRSENDADCTFCPPGYANTNGQGSECTSCGEGFEAIKSIYFTFDSFENGLSTNCSYNCGSDGWQMRGPMVDSGTGHGSYVVSTLFLEQTFSEPGNITFRYSLNCTQGCTLSFTSDIPTLSFRSYGGSLNIFSPTNILFSGQVPAGSHWFSWQFTKNDPFGIAPYDRAILNQLTVTHTEVGGAASCTICPSGHYQPNPASSFCFEAEPGYYAPPGSTEQFPCSGPRDYTDQPGSASCKQCGENVNANADHTGCDITCSYNDNGVFYDLSPLERADGEMYGPVFEPVANTNNSNIYYLNMCTLTHNARVCFDTHNNTIDTYACQVTPLGIGEDLGSVFGILPLDNSLGDFQNYSRSDLGVTVHLTGGAQCHNGSLYFDRQTFIHIVCNENAGVGQVQPLIYGHVEAPKCVYNFYWESLYGCPVCTENDYYFYTTECDANTGYKSKKYQWTLNPKKCHSGVSLPPDERIPCNSNIYCPEGQYVDSDTNTCTYAQPGYYSVGNGIDINDWQTLETGFTTNGWAPSPSGSIASGVGDTSLLYVHEFVTPGFVEYTYYVNTYGDSTAGLSVFLDDAPVDTIIHSTNNTYVTDRIEVPVGYHYIKFLFQGGTATTSENRGRGANIKNMRIVGIVEAADYPIPCPPGYVSDTVGATSCRQCPANKLSSASRTSCEPCSSNYYSLPGSASCTIRPQCEDSDYVAVYGTCYNNQQTVSYDLITPSVCLPSTNVNNSTIVDCTPCEQGLYRDPNPTNGIQACLACGAGSYWSDEAQDCVTARVGHAAVSERSYFTQPIPGSDFPSEFSTGCKGDCVCAGSENACNDGWIFLGDRAISGRNPGQGVDTFLKLVITLDYPGSVEFQYEVSGPSDNGLEFYINDKASIIPYHPASDSVTAKSASSTVFDLEQGYNELVWNYHQVPNTIGQVSLSNILISGVGGAVGDTVCAAGQYSSTTGASYCSDCPPGTANPTPGASECVTCDGNNYSDLPGATSCQVCGENTVANDAGTDCVTNCTYTFNNSTYDITPLRDFHGPYALTTTDDDLWVNLCQKASSNVICLDPTGDSIHTYVCAVNSRGAGTDMGHKLAVTQRASDAAIVFTYTEAQMAHCDTQIALICNTSNTNSIPIEVQGSTACNLRLEWRTAFACPLCTPDDYEAQESKCDNGEKTTNYVRKNNCYGPELLEPKTESCPKTYSVPLAVIIVIVAVFVILILVVAGILLYSRRIRNQYIALVKQSDGQYEMKNIEDTSVSAERVTDKQSEEAKAKEDTV